MAGLGVAALREGALDGRGSSGGDGDFRTASFGEEAVEKFGSGFGVAEGGGHAEDLQFGAAQGQSYGESVVNVVADVGVNVDFLGSGGGRNLRGAGGSKRKKCATQDAKEDGK
jgi:hypothetical protein